MLWRYSIFNKEEVSRILNNLIILFFFYSVFCNHILLWNESFQALWLFNCKFMWHITQNFWKAISNCILTMEWFWWWWVIFIFWAILFFQDFIYLIWMISFQAVMIAIDLLFKHKIFIFHLSKLFVNMLFILKRISSCFDYF